MLQVALQVSRGQGSYVLDGFGQTRTHRQVEHRRRDEGVNALVLLDDRLHDTAGYEALVASALDYRIDVLQRALAALDKLGVSRLREVHRALESDAQDVWGRRLALQASDLVRFSRTYPTWRNAHVVMLDADRKCLDQLACLADPFVARQRATDAGMRETALATVIGLDPIRLNVRSRRLVEGSRVVALHVNDRSLVEDPTTTLSIQKGSFKLGQLPIAVLHTRDGVRDLVWAPPAAPALAVGDELILADTAWFGKPFRSGHEIAVTRPSVDSQSAPKATCEPAAYGSDPETRKWCCRPHSTSEAEWSDTIAQRRARGELNPDVWPPLVDEERFDVGPVSGLEPEPAPGPAPEGVTIDDLD